MSARSFDLNKLNVNQGQIRVSMEGTSKVVMMYATCIVALDEFGITLNSGGYRTATTKTAINNALSQAGYNSKIVQVKGIWYIDNVEFKDGMSLTDRKF